MAQFFTNFESGNLGKSFPGFTTRISRSGDAVDVQHDATVNRKFLRVMKGGTQGSLAVAWDVLNGAQDVEQLILFKMNSANPSPGRYGILLNRYDGSTEETTRGFSATFTPVSNTPSIIISEDSVGTVHFTNYSWANNATYWARFRVTGNTQEFKIWASNAPEPDTWTLSGTFTGSTIANPYSGVGNFQSWSDMTVYQLSAGTNGDSAPMYVDTLQEQTGQFSINILPSSLNAAGYSGGYGGIAGYGQAYGNAFTPTATITDKNQAGKFRVKKTLNQAQAGKFRVQIENTNTQVGKFRVQITNDKPQLGAFRISSEPIRAQSGVFRVERDYTIHQIGKFSIAAPSTEEQSGKFRVQRTIDKVISGAFLIESSVRKHQVGQFRVQVDQTTEQTGIFRVQVSVDKAQSGSFMVRVTNDKDQSGSFVVEYQSNKHQNGLFRIYDRNTLPEVFINKDIYKPTHGSSGNIQEGDIINSGQYKPTSVQNSNYTASGIDEEGIYR